MTEELTFGNFCQFSQVSSLLNLVHNMTVELTFENFYQERLPYSRVAASVCMPVASVQVQILKSQLVTKLTLQNTH